MLQLSWVLRTCLLILNLNCICIVYHVTGIKVMFSCFHVFIVLIRFNKKIKKYKQSNGWQLGVRWDWFNWEVFLPGDPAKLMCADCNHNVINFKWIHMTKMQLPSQSWMLKNWDVLQEASIIIDSEDIQGRVFSHNEPRPTTNALHPHEKYQVSIWSSQ